MASFAPVAPPASAARAAAVAPRAGRSIAGQFHDIAHELWEHRELAAQLTLRDIRLRYKQAAMGFGWALLMRCSV